MNRKRIRKILIILGCILLIISCLLLIGYLYEPFAEKADVTSYPPPGKLVEVGGYRLHINCRGTGSPSVIIDAGWGAWSSAWNNVLDQAAKETRICTYDRAGMGWSDMGPMPRNAKQFAKELHSLLHTANIPKPFVLAGHSSGGLTVRVYAHEYPTDISGLILIDSMSPKMFMPEAMTSHTTNTTRHFSYIPLLARFGVIRGFFALTSMMGNVPRDGKIANAITANPKFVQTFLDEGEEIQRVIRHGMLCKMTCSRYLPTISI